MCEVLGPASRDAAGVLRMQAGGGGKQVSGGNPTRVTLQQVRDTLHDMGRWKLVVWWARCFVRFSVRGNGIWDNMMLTTASKARCRVDTCTLFCWYASGAGREGWAGRLHGSGGPEAGAG